MLRGRLQRGVYLKEQKGHILQEVIIDRLLGKGKACLPKLHVSSTGACVVIRILLRKSAARCIGNINGPKVSRRRGKLQAGWYADRLCPGGNSAVPSDAERFLAWLLGLLVVVRIDLNVMLAGESGGEIFSTSGAEPSWALCSSQKSSRTCFFDSSAMS